MTDPVSMRNTRGYHREMGLAYNLPASALLLAKAAVVHYGRAFLADPLWAKYDVIIDAHALKLQYELHDVNFEHWVRTAKLFIVDHYEATALVPGGSVEGAMATATALPWQEAKLFRVGSIVQESEAVRGKAMLPPDASRIR